MKNIISIIFILLLFHSCASNNSQTKPTIIDHELLEELCYLEKQYARQYENKSEAQVKELCEI